MENKKIDLLEEYTKEILKTGEKDLKETFDTIRDNETPNKNKKVEKILKLLNNPMVIKTLKNPSKIAGIGKTILFFSVIGFIYFLVSLIQLITIILTSIF